MFVTSVATTCVWLDHQFVDDRVVAGQEVSAVAQEVEPGQPKGLASEPDEQDQGW